MADPLPADLRDALSTAQARAQIRLGWLRPCTWVYLVLLGLTLLTFAIGAAKLGGLAVSLSVLGLALVKGHLVGDYFMGLKAVQGPWRWVIAVWLLVPGALIGTAFALAAR